VALILAIIALNGLFVAGETAVDLMKPVHVKHFRDVEMPKRADRLQILLDNKTKYTAACILGCHVCRVGMVLAGLLLAPGVAAWLRPSGPPDWQMLIAAGAIISVPILLLNLVMELVPKSFASLHPMRAGLRLFRFVTIWSVLLSLPQSSLLPSAA